MKNLSIRAALLRASRRNKQRKYKIMWVIGRLNGKTVLAVLVGVFFAHSIYSYIVAPAIIYPAELPESAVKSGADPHGVLSRAVASLTERSDDVFYIIANRPIGMPELDGSCYGAEWQTGKYLKLFVTNELAVPALYDDFANFKLPENKLSPMFVVDYFAGVVGAEKLKIHPVVYETEDGYELSIFASNGLGGHVYSGTTVVSGAGEIETALADLLYELLRPEVVALRGRYRSFDAIDHFYNISERLYGDDRRKFVFDFYRLTTIIFGNLYGAEAMGSAELQSSMSEDLLIRMNAASILDIDIRLWLISNIINWWFYHSLQPDGSYYKIAYKKSELSQAVLRELAEIAARNDISLSQKVKSLYLNQLVKSKNQRRAFEEVDIFLSGLSARDSELAAIALELSAQAVKMHQLALAKSLLAHSQRLENFDASEWVEGEGYSRLALMAYVKMALGESELMEYVISTSEFSKFACASLGFLDDISRMPSVSRSDFDMINDGFQALEDSGLQYFHFYNSWGFYLMDAGIYDDAIERFQTARNFDGDTYWALLNEGNVHLRMGALVKAEELYRQSLDLATIPRAVFGLLDSLAAQESIEAYFVALDEYRSVLRDINEETRRYALQAATLACRNERILPDWMDISGDFDIEFDQATCTEQKIEPLGRVPLHQH